MVAEGMAQGIGASGWQTVLAVFVGDFGLDCYEINISDDLEKGLRSSEKQKQHDYRTHAMSELEVSCRLRLAVINNRNWVVLNYIDIINITSLIYPFIPVIYYPLSIYSSKVI